MNIGYRTNYILKMSDNKIENEIFDETYDLTDEEIKLKIRKIYYMTMGLVFTRAFYPNILRTEIFCKETITYSELFKHLDGHLPMPCEIIKIDMNYIDNINNILNSYNVNIKNTLIKICDVPQRQENEYVFSDIKNIDDLIIILDILTNPPKGFKLIYP